MIAVELTNASVRFSTREGGVSDGPYASLNVGATTDDDARRVMENRRLLAERAGLEVASIAAGLQVHGADIEEWETPALRGEAGFADPEADLPRADGHTTTARGLALLVFAADCLPVALASRGRVAMVHCGWRGVAEGIVGAAVERFEGEPPEAVVGPGIGSCCFEVGREVSSRFEDVDGAVSGAMLDLRRVVEARLAAAGVERVEHVDLCTSCREDLFFSHRRDGGVTGRQCGMVWRS